MPAFSFVDTGTMRYWLMKSEPAEFGIGHLERSRGRKASWTGVRNYQARNFMRDHMKMGDRAFFYHSSCPEPGIAGIVEVCRAAHPDATQFERRSDYYDPAATHAAPRWFTVDVRLIRITPLVSLAELRRHRELRNMRVLAPGNRLSITPVEPREWEFITTRLMRA